MEIGDFVKAGAWLMIVQGAVALLGAGWMLIAEGSEEYAFIGILAFVGVASVVPGFYLLVATE